MKITWDPFRKINERFERWWLRDVLGQVYSLTPDSVVCGKPHRPKARVPLDRIQSWQIIQTMAGTYVELRMEDGKVKSWPDRYDELVELMKRALPEREVPWIAE